MRLGHWEVARAADAEEELKRRRERGGKRAISGDFAGGYGPYEETKVKSHERVKNRQFFL